MRFTSDNECSVDCSQGPRRARVRAPALISGEALQIHRGVGFTWEYAVHRYLRPAKTNQVLWDDPAWHNERIVRCFTDA